MIVGMRRATAILITFQAVVLFIMISLYVNDRHSTHKYDIGKIEESLKSKEFVVHNSNQESVVKRMKNNICLDSQGVYRQCDDDTYEKIIESDRKEQDTDEESNNDKDPSADEKEGEAEISSTKRKVSSLNTGHDDSLDSSNFSLFTADSIWQGKEISKEIAPQQSSAMGDMKKIVSIKVKNADKRFVSDKRILFSDVYEQVDSVEDVNLLVIVTSAARKRARRDSIRATWWTQCPQDSNIRCFFFTDDINSPDLKSAKKELLMEKKKYGDIIFQPVTTGLKFGYRILYQMQWSVAHYRFKYILRVDDDALVCMHHLLYDLSSFPATNLQWGFLHCDSDDLVYIDEGLTIFSRDLVLKFLSQNPLRMRCHVFGDQQVALWINDLNLDPEDFYVHDSRIHHHPPASTMKEYFLELDDMCRDHIIIHGVYPGDMEDFWEVSNRKKDYSRYKPSSYNDSCDKPASFYWYVLQYPFKHKPKYCIKKPQWDEEHLVNDDGTFAGRERNYESF